jgi:hypothetical protein
MLTVSDGRLDEGGREGGDHQHGDEGLEHFWSLHYPLNLFWTLPTRAL